MYRNRTENLSLGEKNGHINSSPQQPSASFNGKFSKETREKVLNNYKPIKTDAGTYNCKIPYSVSKNVNKLFQNKYVIQQHPKNYSTISVRQSKDNTEKFFSEKIREIINNDENIKKSTINVYKSTIKDKWVPEGYIYFDFLLKHPNLMRNDLLSSRNTLKLPKLNNNFKKVNSECNYNNLPNNKDMQKPDPRSILNSANSCIDKKLYNDQRTINDINNLNENNNSNINDDNLETIIPNNNEAINNNKETEEQEKKVNMMSEEDKLHQPLFKEELLRKNRDKELCVGNFMFPAEKKINYFSEKSEPSKENYNDELLLLHPSDKYKVSDVFNLKNDKVFQNKSSEFYLFKNSLNKREEKYTSTTQSGSVWIPKSVKRPTLINHSSVEFNIISPIRKSNALTKENIKKEIKDFYKINSLSQFIDLTRVSAPNINNKYRRVLEENKDNFKLTNEIGACHQNNHFTYRGLCPKPFTNPII